jgi:hypothetical protein
VAVEEDEDEEDNSGSGGRSSRRRVMNTVQSVTSTITQQVQDAVGGFLNIFKPVEVSSRDGGNGNDANNAYDYATSTDYADRVGEITDKPTFTFMSEDAGEAEGSTVFSEVVEIVKEKAVSIIRWFLNLFSF